MKGGPGIEELSEKLNNFQKMYLIQEFKNSLNIKRIHDRNGRFTCTLETTLWLEKLEKLWLTVLCIMTFKGKMLSFY